MNKIKNQQFDKEKSLYHTKDTEINNVIFAGPKDG